MDDGEDHEPTRERGRPGDERPLEPIEARVARVLPFLVQKDGLQPLGIAEWLDTASGDKLMLV